MANASSTATSSASDTTGTPIPLTYGYAWVTGKRHAYYQLLNTNDSVNLYTRLGIWLLGHGEWDGPISLWINDKLVWMGGNTPATKIIRSYGFNWLQPLDGNPEGFVFNFHSGCDTPVGASLTPSSVGPDQNMDLLWPLFPPAIQQLCFSRIAYYSLMRKQPIVNQTSNNGSDPTQWTDIAPIGLWRALRCRLFDDEGNQTGYAFTTNPIWHYIDLKLRRVLMPDYGLPQYIGPDALSAAVRNCFDWGGIYQAAQYCDEFLANGRPRFLGNYSFASQTSEQACREQILLCCRGYQTRYAGKYGVSVDMPRSSVFTFSREHILPGSWEASDQTLHKSANRYISKFRDLLVPLCSYIQSITLSNSGITMSDGSSLPGGYPLVTTTEPHPFEADDWIAIGGTDTPYDGQWEVYKVPAIQNEGTAEEIDPSSFALVPKGLSYLQPVGQVGGCGLLYSRFKERSPEFWHKSNMLARGAVGLNIPRYRSKVLQNLDFATMSWDQVSRLTTYERDRLLGIDQAPYVTPPAVKLRTSFFARDIYGNLAAAVQPGDHVTIDPTANFQYAGEYEVLEPLRKIVPSSQASAQGGEIALKPAENSGEIEFPLGPYNEDVMYDTSDPLQAGWPSVPGSDPGNDSNYTVIPLANGGVFAFFSGILPSGQEFQLPSSGFPASNVLAWASAAGTNDANGSVNTGWWTLLLNIIMPLTPFVSGEGHSASAIVLCSAASTGLLTLNYRDWEGFEWQGILNYAVLTWLSSDAPTVSNGMTWLELTLLGGETILFGQGIFADGATIELPTGYSTAHCFAVANMHDGPTSGSNIAFMMGAYVDSSMVVHYDVSDHTGHTWHGNAQVLIFAWKNNMGTVTTQALGGGNWMEIPLSDGSTFGAGCALNMPDGSTLVLPAAAGDGSTLQVNTGSHNGMNVAGSNHAQGVGACYLDENNIIHIYFQDGSGDEWSGTADVFGLYLTPSAGIPTLIRVTPAATAVAAGAALSFNAAVTGNANPNVTWSVDGIAGGNAAVGTINSAGVYTPPNSTGMHTISAQSVAVPAASGAATIMVWGAQTMPITNIALAPSAPGNFTVAHGLGAAPTSVVITMTSSGGIWLQSPIGFDATNLYLVASDVGVTGNAALF